MREIVHVSTSAWDYVGTLHHASHCASQGHADPPFLFFGSGHLPRDGHAGLNAGMGDHLAELGYTVYRFDLPGLGDSPGDVPRTVYELFWMVHRQWFVSPAAALMNELGRRNGHRRFVVGGVCGAAVTALFLADTYPGLVAGVVGLEAEFFLPIPPQQLTPWQAMKSRASWLRLLTGHSRHSWMIPFPTQPVLDRIGAFLLPIDTDQPLVCAWKRAADRELPILMIMAQGKRHAVFYDQIRKALLKGGGRANLVDVFVRGTNHVFTTGGAKDAVIREVAAWSQTVWPRIEQVENGHARCLLSADAPGFWQKDVSCAGRPGAVVLVPTGSST